MMRGKYPCFSIIDPVTLRTKTAYARRFGFELVHGMFLPTEKWLTTDYTCQNERCVNPFHTSLTSATSLHSDRDKFFRQEFQKRTNEVLTEEKRQHAIKLEQAERDYRRRSTDDGYIDPLQAEIDANRKK